MEQKKSNQANLERQRGKRLLTGLLVAVALLFVALELNIMPSDPLDDPELMEELAREMEMAPMPEPENTLIEQEPEQPKPMEKLLVVDNSTLIDDPDINDETEQPDDSLLMALEPTETLAPIVTTDDDKLLDASAVDDMPQYPGGLAELVRFLTNNLKYPPSAKQRNIQGKVVAQFVVEKDGSLTGLTLVEKVHPLCDNEAMRVLKMMPKWEPGVQNKRPCRTLVAIPIVFRI